MKKFLSLILCIAVILSLSAGCKKTTVSTTPPSEQGTCHPTAEGPPAPIPPMEEDKENESPLGLYEGAAFGLVEKTCEHGITLSIQKQSFFFAWTALAKKAFDHFDFKVGDEVAIPFYLEENVYIASNIERVM